MQPTRILKHLLAPHWLARRAFSPATLQVIEAAVTAAELRHAGELRFVVEAGLPLGDLWRDVTTRERAVEVFSRLRVWDTQHNSGVLIYVQLIDRRVEIVADRGINAKVGQAEWDAICRDMETAFRDKAYLRGAQTAVERIGDLLAVHFPMSSSDPNAATVNELPDRPVLL
ncbi:MAG: TPM domain-containing protein [Betaproteobacteria bacterium]|nr:TPM domain-containing protein [Betaproteobacteria bacterium]